MVVTPRPTRVPANGLCHLVMEPVAVQLSDTVTPPSTLGTAAWQLAFEEAVVPTPGQLMVGGVVSLTVKVVGQVLLLDAASVAVTVIVVTPSPTKVPAVGLWLRVIEPAG